jgi:transcriptional regulator with XRE-family HTH domain
MPVSIDPMPRRPKKQRTELAQIIRRLRVALGDTQQQFALRLDTSITSIARYETNSTPAREVIDRMADLAREEGLPKFAELLEHLKSLLRPRSCFEDALTIYSQPSWKMPCLHWLCCTTLRLFSENSKMKRSESRSVFVMCSLSYMTRLKNGRTIIFCPTQSLVELEQKRQSRHMKQLQTSKIDDEPSEILVLASRESPPVGYRSESHTVPYSFENLSALGPQ